jgi:hypothetical protein
VKLILFFIFFLLTSIASADQYRPARLGTGAFLALMVQAPDVDKYITALKNNNAPFKAGGSSVAGVCLTKTGNDYPGQMFVWNGFDSVAAAMASIDKYDPSKATLELLAMREAKYSVIFKPLKEYILEPGSERLWRLQVSHQNLPVLVTQIEKLQKALRSIQLI